MSCRSSKAKQHISYCSCFTDRTKDEQTLQSWESSSLASVWQWDGKLWFMNQGGDLTEMRIITSIVLHCYFCGSEPFSSATWCCAEKMCLVDVRFLKRILSAVIYGPWNVTEGDKDGLNNIFQNLKKEQSRRWDSKWSTWKNYGRTASSGWKHHTISYCILSVICTWSCRAQPVSRYLLSTGKYLHHLDLCILKLVKMYTVNHLSCDKHMAARTLNKKTFFNFRARVFWGCSILAGTANHENKRPVSHTGPCRKGQQIDRRQNLQERSYIECWEWITTDLYTTYLYFWRRSSIEL